MTKNQVGMDMVQAFYEKMEQDDLLTARVDALIDEEATIEKILERTVRIAAAAGFFFTLAELKVYLIQKEDIEVR